MFEQSPRGEANEHRDKLEGATDRSESVLDTNLTEDNFGNNELEPKQNSHTPIETRNNTVTIEERDGD